MSRGHGFPGHDIFDHILQYPQFKPIRRPLCVQHRTSHKTCKRSPRDMVAVQTVYASSRHLGPDTL